MDTASKAAFSLSRRRFAQAATWTAMAGAAAWAIPAAGTAAASGWQPVVLPRTMQLSWTSRHTGRSHRIYVSQPDVPPPACGFPVLYLLDGDALFPTATAMNHTIASRTPRTGITPALVVGLGYGTDDEDIVRFRALDYTPYAGEGTPEGEGGAARFLDFIGDELKPLIEGTFPVDTRHQALFGHSYGGLLVLHALSVRTAMFQTYLASSPSIWWGKRFVRKALDTVAPGPANLLVTVGGLEDRLPDGPPDLVATLAQRPMIEPARELAAALAANHFWKGRLSFTELPGEDHGSAKYPALSRGFEFFLG